MVEETAEGFALALMERDPQAGASYFSDSGILVTPDGTGVSGRRRIREVLEQVTASDLDLRIATGKVLVANDLALCQQIWSRSSRSAPIEEFCLTSKASLVLARPGSQWKIQMATPWQ